MQLDVIAPEVLLLHNAGHNILHVLSRITCTVSTHCCTARHNGAQQSPASHHNAALACIYNVNSCYCKEPLRSRFTAVVLMAITDLNCCVSASVLAPVKQSESTITAAAIFGSTLARLVVYVCIVEAAPPVHVCVHEIVFSLQ
jgi:hypothetical protein